MAVFEDIPTIAVHDLDHVLVTGNLTRGTVSGCWFSTRDAELLEGKHDPLPVSDFYNPGLAVWLLVGPGNVPRWGSCTCRHGAVPREDTLLCAICHKLYPFSTRDATGTPLLLLWR